MRCMSGPRQSRRQSDVRLVMGAHLTCGPVCAKQLYTLQRRQKALVKLATMTSSFRSLLTKVGWLGAAVAIVRMRSSTESAQS